MTLFSEEAWQRTARLRMAINELRFNTELASGRLSRERFQGYIVQDALYLAQYSRILEQAGLFVHSALWFERPTRLEGSGGLASWLELFCLPLLLALGERRAEVVAGVERRCRAQLYRDGSWWLDYTRLRVVAAKP